MTEGLEAGQLLAEVHAIAKGLGAEEQLIVYVIEPLHNPVPPWLTLGDEADFHAQLQAKPEEEPKAAGGRLEPRKASSLSSCR